MSTLHLRWHVNAPRERVYATLIDGNAVQAWRVPDAMTSQVHSYEARPGGKIRVSLTYSGPTGTGKTTAQTDTYSGYFAELVPDAKVVEVIRFESADPSLQNEMTVTFALKDAPGGGTDIEATHAGVPDSVPVADNELGWHQSLSKLSALLDDG